MFSEATLRQTLCVSSVYGTSFINGIESAWSGPALKILTSADSPIPFEKGDIPWLAFSATLGDIIGVIISGLLFESVGRKTLTLLCVIFLVFSWLVTSWATSFDMLLVGKFLVNAAIGLHDVSNCFYISEVVSAENRSVFIAILLVFYTFGIESQFLVGLFENYYFLNMFPLIMSLITLILIFYAIESPYYLLSKNQTAQAWKGLSTLNGNKDFQRMAQEYDDLVRLVQEESVQGSFLKFLFSPQNYKMCLCAITVYAIAYMNSALLILGYVPVVFEQFADDLNFNVIMNLVGFINVIGITISTIIIEKFGRRTLLMLSLPCTAFVQFFMAFGFYIEDYFGNSIHFLPYCVIAAAMIDVVFFFVITCPVVHVLRSEILPPKLKSSGTCVMLLLRSVIQGSILSLFLPISSALGMGFNFVIHGTFASYGAYFVYKYLKETKGRTLIEIRNDYTQL